MSRSCLQDCTTSCVTRWHEAKGVPAPVAVEVREVPGRRSSVLCKYAEEGQAEAGDCCRGDENLGWGAKFVKKMKKDQGGVEGEEKRRRIGGAF